MFKRSHYIALASLALLTLVLLNLPSRTTDRIKLAIGSLFLPLFGLSRASHQASMDAGNAVTPKSDLLKLVSQLQMTNQQLQIRAMQADSLQAQNDQLRAQLQWQRQSPWKERLANVVQRDPANWWHTVWIDLGARDGMRVDMPVMTSAGLVGRISKVSLTSSQVALIGNPDCRVAVLVEKNREMGVIVGGASPLDNSLVTLTHLSSASNLKPGQTVLTSGYGRIFPAGIPVGVIADEARPVEYGLYTEARVKLGANLASLEQVWVITNDFQMTQ